MFEMGAETMHLPLEEKMKYEQGDEGMSFGYAHVLISMCNATLIYYSSLQLQSRRRECD